MEENYKEELTIDPDNLDLECLHQPSLFMKYSELQVEAKKEYDLAKRNLDRTYSQIAREVRTNPEVYGIEKVSEASIKEVVECDDEVEEANKDFINARYNYEVLSSVVNAFEQRRRSLANLVSLHGQNYFASPEAQRPLTREFSKKAAQKEVVSKVRSRLNRKKEGDD